MTLAGRRSLLKLVGDVIHWCASVVFRGGSNGWVRQHGGQQRRRTNTLQEISLRRFQLHEATQDMKQVHEVGGVFVRPVIRLNLVER